MIITRNILILTFISSITFWASNFLLDGTLKSNINLGGELKSPADSLYQWSIGNEAPFKYRVLHRAIVSGTYALLKGDTHNNHLFFTIYTVYALLAHIVAVILFHFLIGITTLKDFRLIGAVLFALLPPLLFAYNVPVHTREDTLAYCLLLVGMICVLRDKPLFVLLASIAGVLCRETLLMVPVIYLLFQHKQKFSIRLSILIASIALFAILRFYIGLNKYDHAEGLRWNLSHPDQLIGFLFISFGFLWLPFFLTLFTRKDELSKSSELYILQRSAPVALALILITTFLGGIFNEIRLLYLLAPWIIPLALYHYRNNQLLIMQRATTKPFVIYAVITTITVVLVTMFVMSNYELLIPASKFGISYSKWILVTCIQTFVTLLTVPLLIRVAK